MLARVIAAVLFVGVVIAPICVRVFSQVAEVLTSVLGQ